jgi:hypothetical protein
VIDLSSYHGDICDGHFEQISAKFDLLMCFSVSYILCKLTRFLGLKTDLL